MSKCHFFKRDFPFQTERLKLAELRHFVRGYLGGVFKKFLFSPRTLGQWSNLTNIFQMGWFNHQLDLLVLQREWVVSIAIHWPSCKTTPISRGTADWTSRWYVGRLCTVSGFHHGSDLEERCGVEFFSSSFFWPGKKNSGRKSRALFFGGRALKMGVFLHHQSWESKETPPMAPFPQ